MLLTKSTCDVTSLVLLDNTTQKKLEETRAIDDRISNKLSYYNINTITRIYINLYEHKEEDKNNIMDNFHRYKDGNILDKHILDNSHSINTIEIKRALVDGPCLLYIHVRIHPLNDEDENKEIFVYEHCLRDINILSLGIDSFIIKIWGMIVSKIIYDERLTISDYYRKLITESVLYVEAVDYFKLLGRFVKLDDYVILQNEKRDKWLEE